MLKQRRWSGKLVMKPQDNKVNTVVVVTISHSFPWLGNETTVRCFSSFAKAERWVEGQIDEKVKEYDLDRDRWVDDWFVRLGCEEHTFQYDAQEMEVE